MAAEAGSLEQNLDAALAEALQHCGLASDSSRLGAVRRALCPPPIGQLAPCPGALELLSRINALGLRCIAVSNATFRDRHAYRRDFEAVGLGRYVDDVVSSVDVGFGKPHRAMLDAALGLAGCPPERCAMVGNSELKDVQPALALGMRTILACITEPRPPTPNAYAVVGSLHEAAGVMERWTSPSID